MASWGSTSGTARWPAEPDPAGESGGPQGCPGARAVPRRSGSRPLIASVQTVRELRRRSRNVTSRERDYDTSAARTEESGPRVVHYKNLCSLFPLEVDEQSAEVLGILFDPVILGLDFLLVQEAQHVLLQLTRTLAGNDLDQRGLLGFGLGDDVAQRPVDIGTPVVDVVQVQLQLHAPT